MKLKQGCLFLTFMFIFVLLLDVVEVDALNTGFKINQLSNEEKNLFVSNIDMSLVVEEPVKKTIICIDVSSSRLIAVGQNTSNRKTICIYSDEGVFQYGYTFICSGDFGVEWDECNLNIYFVRSSVVVSVNPMGEVLDVLEVQNSSENNSYVNNFIHSTKRIIGDTEYLIRNNMGILSMLAPSYSQIIVKDSNGIERVIYDVESIQHSNMILTIGIVCVFVVAVIAVIAWQFINLRRDN